MPRFRWQCEQNANGAARQFSCVLRCRRCSGTKQNGQRCTRRTCKTYEYCWQHLRSHRRVNSTRQSNILNNQGRSIGRGLFAYHETRQGRANNGIVFQNGQRIGYYIAESITNATLDNRYGPGDHQAPYAVNSGAGLLDGACVRGFLNQANGSLNLQNSNARFGDIQNFTMVNISFPGHAPVMKRAIPVHASRIIRHNDEIIIHYGNDYLFSEPGCSHSTR